MAPHRAGPPTPRNEQPWPSDSVPAVVAPGTYAVEVPNDTVSQSIARERAFLQWLKDTGRLGYDNVTAHRDGQHTAITNAYRDAFLAGWIARKRAQYETLLNQVTRSSK